jgi:hypothetical protein
MRLQYHWHIWVLCRLGRHVHLDETGTCWFCGRFL